MSVEAAFDGLNKFWFP